VKKILFVCRTNAACSPLAATVFNHFAATKELSHALRASSRGMFPGSTARPVDRRMQVVAEQGGFDLSGHLTKEFEILDFTQSSLVLCLDEDSYWAIDSVAKEKGVRGDSPGILHLFTEDSGQLGQREIPDPLLGEATFEDAYTLILTFTERIFKRICAAEGL
jgi:protein-tyrosine-phosphatase